MPGPRRPGFNSLRVAELVPVTDDAVSVTFDLPFELAEAYAHQPGQYLTIRATLEGRRLMRRYSICTAAGSGTLGIAVKRRRDGLFSNHLVEHLRAGDVLDVMTPMGGFCAAIDAGAVRHHVGVAVGSGITPVRSIATTVLAQEPRSRVTLIYANRTPASTMFRADLDDMGLRYQDRFRLIEVFSESGPVSAYLGRLDPDLLCRIADAHALVPASAVWYLSGPYDLVEALKERLIEAGVDGGAVRTESFFRPEESPVQPARVG